MGLEEAIQNEEDAKVFDAWRMVQGIRSVRQCVKENDAELAARLGIRLGEIVIKIKVRPHEKPAITGRKNRAFLAKLREAKSKRLAIKHNKVIRLFSEIKEQYEPHERPSDTQIKKLVSEHLRMPYKTVKSILYRASLKSSK